MAIYTATRKITMGKFAGQEAVPIPEGATVEFDGTTLKIGDKTDQIPNFDVVINQGWVVLAKGAKKAVPVTTEAPASAEAASPQVRAPKSNAKVSAALVEEYKETPAPMFKTATKKPEPAPQKKTFPLVESQDETPVATGISQKGLPKKPPQSLADSAKVQKPINSGVLEEIGGEAVPIQTTFKSKAKSQTRISV